MRVVAYGWWSPHVNVCCMWDCRCLRVLHVVNACVSMDTSIEIWTALITQSGQASEAWRHDEVFLRGDVLIYGAGADA